MTYTGHIENGVVVLDNGNGLPEGARVEVRLRPDAADALNPGTPESHPVERQESSDAREEGPSLYERMKDLAGAAKGLPPDFARNHDHYIHGAPKK